MFFMVVTVSLWLDQLINSTIGDLADFQMLYKITSIVTLIVSVQYLHTTASVTQIDDIVIGPMVDDGMSIINRF